MMKMRKNLLAALMVGTMILGTGSLNVMAAASGSYELGQNDMTITVTVPLGGNANWYVDADSQALELLTAEISNGTWVGSFRAAGPVGADELEVRCFADGLLYGYYKVDTDINIEGEITVTKAYGDMEDYHGAADDSPTEFGQAGYEEYPAYVTASKLLLRDAPVNGSVRATMPRGTKVEVVGLIDGWAMVIYGDTVGYCYNGYLSTTKPSGAAQQTATPSRSNALEIRVDKDEYIIKESGARKLTEADLTGMSGNEIQMAINEVYARHGRRFALTSVQKFFDEKSWYLGQISALDFDPNVLSDVEEQNLAFMENYMAAHQLYWDFS